MLTLRKIRNTKYVIQINLLNFAFRIKQLVQKQESIPYFRKMNTKTCAFTIVAKNYIGLGQILGRSLSAHNPEVDFRIYVADSLEGVEDVPDGVIEAKRVINGITDGKWTDMAFKYDLTEFCTAIKPFCFSHVFSDGYGKALYFDPDIFIFSPINDILDALDIHVMTLTPQVAGIHADYTGEHPEWAMNVNGIFNLGFCGITNSDTGRRAVEWWQKRLLDHCHADRSVGEFTDQKWMDWMPGFLGNELCVMRSLGMNMAPWNFFERELFTEGGDIMVRYRTDDTPQRTDRLVFLHFAGYDYTQMKQGKIERKRIEDLQDYPDLKLATGLYRDAIVREAATFDSFITQPYTYAAYDNGDRIAAFHRRLYNGTEEAFANPFATGKGTFHDLIRKRGMIMKENIDNLSRRNVSGMQKKQRMLALLYGILFRVMGYGRYVQFLKSHYFYCRPEKHTFLINK